MTDQHADTAADSGADMCAQTVAVRVADLREVVRAFYASIDMHGPAEIAAANRLHIQLLGVKRLLKETE